MSNIGTRIKQRREQLGITQDELAKLLGYKNKTSITKIENGINDISQSKVIDFAEALNTTPAFLMGWDAPVEENKQPYYLDPEAAKFAQEVYEQPEKRILFDAINNVPKEDLELALEILAKFKK